jgi:hypothetical protein
MTDSVMLDRIAARRAELDLLEEELVKQLADVRVERDELVVAERVVQCPWSISAACRCPRRPSPTSPTCCAGI